MQDQTDADVIIIGGGFSTMALVRELERTGQSFRIISDKRPIWKQLEEKGELGFDLVSSIHSSFYSWELVALLDKQKGVMKDGFPTASEYYDYIKKYAAIYEDAFITGFVSEIINHKNHSVVRLATGEEYTARHVVLSTAFHRKIHESLKNLKIDESFAGKSVAVTAHGDSSNLIIAKLVGHGAKVHLVTNGCIMLDKVFATYSPLDDGARLVSLDQFECQNVRELSRRTYQSFNDAGYLKAVLYPWLANIFDRNSMAVRQPVANRPRRDLRSIFKAKTPVENGHIAIKYWPIDSYKVFCGDNLEQEIGRGLLLNDLPFFVEHGFVDLWDKSETAIDRKAMTLQQGDRKVDFDLIVDGDHEEPAIPDIRYEQNGEQKTFRYEYRDTYLGVIPPELSNIYTVGYTRPMTGGLNNITEMQSLLVHRMIDDDKYREKVRSDLPERIRKYNKAFYADRPAKPTDHLVWYGVYTDEVAKALDIRPSVRDAKSLYDVVKYYFFPNNAYYFRENGRYKVEGVDRLIREISRHNQDYRVLMMLLARYPAFELVALGAIAFAPIPWWSKIILGLVHYRLPFTSLLVGKLGIPSKDSKLLFNYRRATVYPTFLYPILAGVAFFTGGMPAAFALSAAMLVYVYAMVNLGCFLGWNRKIFCDMRSKRDPKYRQFFDRYLEVFRKVASTGKRSEGAINSGAGKEVTSS